MRTGTASLGRSLASIARQPLHFLLNGASYQLWFLPSLCQAAVIVFVFVRMGLRRWLIPCTLALFVVGLLGQGYSKLPFGLHLNTRTGPFFGSFLFALGFVMSSRTSWTRVRPWQLILAGYGLMALEMVILYRWAGVGWVAHYYAGSVLVAAGFLLLATSRPGLFGNSLLPRLGRLTLGVYVTHVILLNLAEDEFLIDLFRDSAVLALVYPVLVYACSLLLVLGLLRVPLLRRWVA